MAKLKRLSSWDFVPRSLLIACALFSLVSAKAFSAEITPTSYDIYIGDVNGDGLSDYYLVAKPLMIILHGDVVTPLSILVSPNFVIYRNGSSYTDAQIFSLSSTVLAQKIAAGTLRLAVVNTDFLTWNNGIAGQTYVLLRGADVNAPSLLLNSFSTASLPLNSQVYPPNGVANLSDKNLTISLQDPNQDGKKDLVINNYVYLSDASGVPGLVACSLNQSGPLTTTFTYDVLGRVIKVESLKDGSQSTYQYDSQDNRTSSNNVKGIAP